MGPDERSQALLLRKAIEQAKENRDLIYKDWIKSTPGILVKGFKDNKTFYSFLNSILKGTSYLILDNQTDFKTFINENLSHLSELLFILPTYTISKDNSDVFKLFRKFKNIKFRNLSKIEGIENKILYINYQIDHQIYNDS